MHTPSAPERDQLPPGDIDAIPGIDPETAAIIAIERILNNLDAEPRPANTRAPSARVLSFVAEKHRIIGSPGRKPRSQGGR